MQFVAANRILFQEPMNRNPVYIIDRETVALPREKTQTSDGVLVAHDGLSKKLAALADGRLADTSGGADAGAIALNSRPPF
jgi:hypothetical protein